MSELNGFAIDARRIVELQAKVEKLESALLKCRQASMRGLSAEELRLRILAETDILLYE